MKKIYVSHSKSFDFKKKLYTPLKKIAGFNFILPHEKKIIANSKEIIKKSSCFIADVSNKSLGVGIEIGWASAYKIPIIFIYKKDTMPSKSLRLVSKYFLKYSDLNKEINKLKNLINKIV